MSTVLSAVAWPYANGPRHIGHVAGFGVPSDVFSRYMRMAGHDVLMVSGTDEHGTPILVAADSEGISARELADRNNRVIVEDLVALGLSYDLFTRTTTGNHEKVVQQMFVSCRDNGYMISEDTDRLVRSPTVTLCPDRYIEGTCPICGADGARGDQCDNCGNQLDPPILSIRSPRRSTGDTRVHGDSALVPGSSCAGRGTGSSGSTSVRKPEWRHNVISFTQNILEDIRPRAMSRDISTGASRCRAGRISRISAFTCGSMR